MRPIRVDFVSSKAYRLIWLLVLGVCALLILVSLGQRHELDSARREMQSERGALEVQRENWLAKQRQASGTKESDGMRNAVRDLLQDPNIAFSVAESIAVEGARLQALSIDKASNRIRLEYELTSMGAVTSISQTLNVGFDRPPWSLESVTRTNTGSATTPVPVTTAYVLRASWVGQLDLLR